MTSPFCREEIFGKLLLLDTSKGSVIQPSKLGYAMLTLHGLGHFLLLLHTHFTKASMRNHSHYVLKHKCSCFLLDLTLKRHWFHSVILTSKLVNATFVCTILAQFHDRKPISRGALLLLIFLFSTEIHAKPASPYPVKRQMPDGTEITVLIKGDEKQHVLFSLDGYLLLSNEENLLFYADSNARCSPYQAHDIEKRSAEEKAFLQLLDKEKIKTIYFQ